MRCVVGVFIGGVCLLLMGCMPGRVNGSENTLHEYSKEFNDARGLCEGIVSSFQQQTSVYLEEHGFCMESDLEVRNDSQKWVVDLAVTRVEMGQGRAPYRVALLARITLERDRRSGAGTQVAHYYNPNGIPAVEAVHRRFRPPE